MNGHHKDNGEQLKNLAAADDADELDVDVEILKDTECGLGSFRPKGLQICARIGAFIGVFSVSGLLTQTLTTYVNSQVSMLEKQFGFSSAESGLLMSCNDIGFLCCALFAGYIAKIVHIPRGLGISTLLYGVCGIMCALPYFLQDPASYALKGNTNGNVSKSISFRSAGKEAPMCQNVSMFQDDTSCDMAGDTAEANSGREELHIKSVAFALIAFGMFLQGVGKSFRSPFVTLYIDDAVDKRKTGFYMGILIGTGIFGPALAYLLGGVFSRIYITLEAVDISPKDPRWLGAWWLGFLVFGGFALLFSVPTMCFPRYLKSKKRKGDLVIIAKERRLQRETQVSVWKSLLLEMKEFVATGGRLLRNPTYMILIISTVVNLVGVAGTMSFMPKYLASQYTIPLWQANIILSLSSVSAVSLGTFLGGVMTRKIPMMPQTTVKMLLIFYTVNTVCIAAGFFLGCDQPMLVGGGPSNVGNASMPLYKHIQSHCVDGCTCDDEQYFPICGDDGRSYFSPCHAGCTGKSPTDFFNCTCIPSGHAESGLCDQGCNGKLYAYAVFTFVGKLFTAFKIVPTVIAQIRCVQETDRAASTAFASFVTSALGWMPGPIIFGAIIDDTCLLWKYTCGERQSCRLYDLAYFRNAILGYAVITSALATLILSSLFFYFRYKNTTEWHQGAQKEELVADVELILNTDNANDHVKEH